MLFVTWERAFDSNFSGFYVEQRTKESVYYLPQMRTLRPIGVGRRHAASVCRIRNDVPHSIHGWSLNAAAPVPFTHSHKKDTRRSECTMYVLRATELRPSAIHSRKTASISIDVVNQFSSLSVLTPSTLFLWVRFGHWYNFKVEIIWRFTHLSCDCNWTFPDLMDLLLCRNRMNEGWDKTKKKRVFFLMFDSGEFQQSTNFSWFERIEN